MRAIQIFLLLAILFHGLPCLGQTAPRAARHDVWERSVEAARAAIGERSTSRAAASVESALHEAISMRPDDPRVRETLDLVNATMDLHATEIDPKAAFEYLVGVRAYVEKHAGRSHELALRVLMDMGRRTASLGNPLGAEVAFREVWERATASHGPAHPITVRSGVKLSETLARLGRFDEALEIAERARRGAMDAFGENHPLYWDATLGEAQTLALANRFDDARVLVEDVDARILAEHGQYHLRRARTQAMFATLALDTYRHEDAVAAAQLSVKIFRLNGIAIDTRLAEVLGSLAKANHRLHRLDDAQRAAREQLAMMEQIFNAEAGPLAAPLVRLADIEIDRQKPAQAKILLERAIETQGGLYESHVIGGDLGARLAEIESLSGNVREADETFALAIMAARERRDEPGLLGRQLVRLAGHQLRTDRWEAAAESLVEALPLVDTPGAYKSRVLLQGLHLAARVEAKLGDAKKARERYAHALAESEIGLGEASFFLVPLLRDYGSFLESQNERQQALALTNRAQQLTEQQEAWLSSSRGARVLYENDELNLRVTRPPAPWISMDPEGLNAEAKIAFVNTEDDTWATVSAMALPSSSMLTSERFSERTKANLARQDGYTLLSTGRRALSGIPGLEFFALADNQGQPFIYRVWSAVHNGYAYQIVVWARSDQPEFREGSDPVLEVIAPIDVARLAPGWESPIERYESPQFGYEVDLATTGLRPYPVPREDLAQFGAMRASGDAGILVLPFSLLGARPSRAELERTLEGLLSIDEETRRERITLGDLAGVEIDFAQQTEPGRALYRSRLLHGDGRAFIVLAWGGDDEDSGRNSLDLVEITQTVPPIGIEQLEPRDRERHATLFVELGIRARAIQRHDLATRYLEIAVDLRPEEPAVRSDWIVSLLASQDYPEAERAVEQASRDFADDGRFPALGCVLFQRTGRLDQAIASFERASDLGFRDEDIFATYIEVLVDADQASRALRELDQRIEETGSIALQQLRIVTLQQLGRGKQAVKYAKALLDAQPGNSDLRYSLAQLYIEFNQAEQALALLSDLEKTLGETIRILSMRASAQYQLGQYADARASILRLREVDPSDPRSEEFLAILTSLTGQGENELARRRIEPVEPNGAAASASERTPRDALAREHGAYYLDFSRAYQFERGRALRRTDRFTVQVSDRRGVTLFSTLRMPFDPQHERIFVNEVVVRDRNGDEISRTDALDSYVFDDLEQGMVTTKKILNIPIRGLRPGTRVEIVVTREDRSPSEDFPYESIVLARDIPVVRSSVVIRGDVDAIRHEYAGGVKHEKRAGLLSWWVDDPPVHRAEVLQPPPEVYLPVVRLATVDRDWETLGEEYLSDIAAPLSETEAAEALVAELLETDDAPPDRAGIVRRLVSAVQAGLRYEAIEFGRHSRVPSSTARVLENRYGDCKDHALLLHQLLESAGIESQLALVRNGGPVFEEFPSLLQFDHMVVHCSGCPGGARFLDATDKSTSPDARVPIGLGGQQSLVLDPAAPRLVLIPDEVEQSVVVDRVVEVQTDGSTEVAETVQFGGEASSWIRGVLTMLDRGSWEANFFHPVVAAGMNLDFREIEADHLSTEEGDVSLTLRYGARGFFTPTDDKLIGSAPAIWERLFLSVDSVPDRRSPFRLRAPLRVRTHTELRAPDRHRFAKRKRGGSDLDDLSFYRWSDKVKRKAKQVVIDVDLTRVRGDFPAARYREFESESQRILERIDENFVLEKR